MNIYYIYLKTVYCNIPTEDLKSNIYETGLRGQPGDTGYDGRNGLQGENGDDGFPGLSGKKGMIFSL